MCQNILLISQPIKSISVSKPREIAIWGHIGEKCEKIDGGWEKFRETLILSEKLTIMKKKNGLKVLDKQ